MGLLLIQQAIRNSTLCQFEMVWRKVCPQNEAYWIYYSVQESLMELRIICGLDSNPWSWTTSHHELLLEIFYSVLFRLLPTLQQLWLFLHFRTLQKRSRRKKKLGIETNFAETSNVVKKPNSVASIQNLSGDENFVRNCPKSTSGNKKFDKLKIIGWKSGSLFLPQEATCLYWLS